MEAKTEMEYVHPWDKPKLGTTKKLSAFELERNYHSIHRMLNNVYKNHATPAIKEFVDGIPNNLPRLGSSIDMQYDTIELSTLCRMFVGSVIVDSSMSTQYKQTLLDDFIELSDYDYIVHFICDEYDDLSFYFIEG